MSRRKATPAANASSTQPLAAAADTAAPAPDPTVPATPDPAVDPDAAKAAYKRLLPQLRAFGPEKLRANRSDMQAAAVSVLGLVHKLAAMNARPRFALLPDNLFSIATFDLLGPAAEAAFYAQVLLDSAMATTSDVKVPLPIVKESATVEARMMKVADYHLHHRSDTLAREIDDIRSGTGHADLASDLSRLKILYTEQRALLPQHDQDPHYRPQDADEAGRLSSTILAELAAAQTKAQREAQDMAVRAWTLLVLTYEDIADAGRLVLKKEGGGDLFPSLYTAGRSPSAARRAKPAPPAGETPPAKTPAK